MPLPTALLLELSALLTPVLPHESSFHHSSLACASYSLPTIDGMHFNATSAVLTQAAAAYVLPLSAEEPYE